jgi:hypothetical protein
MAVETDENVQTNEIAIGVSQNWDVGPGFGGRGSYLLGWGGVPHTIDTGSGSYGLKLATRLGASGIPLALAIDQEGTVHVLGDGFLRAYEIGLSANYPDPGTGGFATQVAVTGGGDLGLPHAIAVGVGTALPMQDGDYDGNGTVGPEDYVLWRDTSGQNVDPGTGADGSGNGTVGPEDYDFWLERFGNGGATTGAAVPEPAACTLWMMATLCALGSARRRKK